MVYIKSPEEIRAIILGGKILARIREEILAMVKPGANTEDIERLAEQRIIEAGGGSAFKNYPLPGGIFFPSVVCASLNDEVVHGSTLPNRIIQSGDIVDLDIGMEWPIRDDLRKKHNLPFNKHSKLGGFFTDTCKTVGAGKISKEAKILLKAASLSLQEGIKVVRPGLYLAELGETIEKVALKYNLGVVKDYVGHGVGYYAHEAPDIFNYKIDFKLKENLCLKEGMVIAIEPMFNLGSEDIDFSDNGYTVKTYDGSLSAHFEHTVIVSKNSYIIAT